MLLPLYNELFRAYENFNSYRFFRIYKEELSKLIKSFCTFRKDLELFRAYKKLYDFK